MPDESNNQGQQPVHAKSRGKGPDRVRLLRDATSAFLLEPEGNMLAARQYAALAAGFLPQIARGAALDIARMLAARPHLPEAVQNAFRAVGIRFRRQTSASTRQRETTPMAEHRFFAGPLMDGTDTAVLPDHAHLDPSALHGRPLDSVTALALTRAAERNDIEDFSTIIAEALARMRVAAFAEAIAHMLQEQNCEPAALIISAIGGDRNLLTRTIAAFNADRSDLPARVHAASAQFGSLQREKSLALLGRYFSAAERPRPAAAQHVTVQAGQSLRLRATSTGQKPPVRASLSERLGQSLRK